MPSGSGSGAGSAWRRGQALPPPPPPQSQSQQSRPQSTRGANTANTTNTSSNTAAALPGPTSSTSKPAAATATAAKAARTVIPPAPAVNPWGSGSAAGASANLAPKRQSAAGPNMHKATSTASAASASAASASAARPPPASAVAVASAWGLAAASTARAAPNNSNSSKNATGGVQILQKRGKTTAARGGRGAAEGKKGNSNTASSKQHRKQQQQRQQQQQPPPRQTEEKKEKDKEEFPSLQLQSVGDFPSLSAGTSKNTGAGGGAISSSATAGKKSIIRGWEAAKPKALSAVPKQQAANNSDAKKVMAAAKGQKAKGKARASEDNNSSEKNKKSKKKKNKKGKKVPADPRLAAAFQPLPAARTDDAHAAHMIHFPLAAAAAAVGGTAGGGGGGHPKHKRAGGGLAHVDHPTAVIAKGRQRLGPRKKRLSTLKKKVLQERLKVWKERNGIVDVEEEGVKDGGGNRGTAGADTASASIVAYHTVCLRNFVTDEEELVDDDEYDEIVSDLRNLATKIGPVAEVYIPRRNDVDGGDANDANGNDDGPDEDEKTSSSVVGLAFVRYQKEHDARAAIASFDALTIGGGKIEPTAVVADGTAAGAKGDDWRSLMHRYSPSAQAAASASEAKSSGPGEGTDGDTAIVVVLENILSDDDFDDEDCLAESTDDIRALAEQFGTVQELTPHIDGEWKGQVHVTYKGDFSTGQNAATKLNGMVIGGSSISARVLNDGAASAILDQTTPVLILEDMLTEDDFEDEDCLQESVEDILTMCKEIGEVASIKAHTEGDHKGHVHVVYAGDEGADHATSAVTAFNGKVVGGETISARLHMPSSSVEAPPVLILRNLITEDDYEDEDVLEETKADAMEMLREYGDVEEMKVHVDGDKKGEIHVTYAGGGDITSKAQAGIHGIVRGGHTIEAELFAPCNSAGSIPAQNDADDGAEKPKPMMSGDKVIPERYAECKRAPKVPNKGIPRAYATKIDDDNVVPLINEMLGELMRLQLRSKDDKNARARRRLVMGLREVARGIKSHKVKMVIMADNLDEYGAIDEKLQEILDLAEKEDVPVFFELSKRRLGKALGKSIKVAVVGIYSADGAYQQFKQLQKIYLRAPRKAPPASKD